jgi:hypothetical protein
MLALAGVLIALLAFLYYWLQKLPYDDLPETAKITTNQAIISPSATDITRGRSDSDIKATVSEETQEGNISAGTLRLLENLNCYVNSQARDTPQYKAIAALLSRHNLGPDSVKDAYNLAWHANSLANRIELEADLSKGSLQFVKDLVVPGSVYAFVVRYGVTKVSFFD